MSLAGRRLTRRSLGCITNRHVLRSTGLIRKLPVREARLCCADYRLLLCGCQRVHSASWQVLRDRVTGPLAPVTVAEVRALGVVVCQLLIQVGLNPFDLAGRQNQLADG